MEFYRVEFLMENFKNSTEEESKRHREEKTNAMNEYSMGSNNPMKDQKNLMQKYIGSNNIGRMPKF
jgi:hypothetical protein